MIYHWCPREHWDGAGDVFVSTGLDEEGFIHFSFRHQVSATASKTDRGREGLVLLCVDENRLEVVTEDLYEIGELYPHVHGPIPRSSVVGVIPFPPEPDGSFKLPLDLPG